MDHALLEQLSQATLFDLYRLQVLITKEIKNPKRIAMVKEKLRIGMTLSYFDRVTHKLVKATLLEIRAKNAMVLDCEQNKRWVIPYCMLNIEGVDMARDNTGVLTANSLQVGDCVGFNKGGQSIVGLIKRINLKSVTLVTSLGQQWRVAYALLYRVCEGKAGAGASTG